MNYCGLCEGVIKVNYHSENEGEYTCNDCYEESIRDKSKDFFGIIQRNKRKAEKLKKESEAMGTYEYILSKI